MIYEATIINPKTNEEQNLTVELSAEQLEASKIAPCLQTFVQETARASMPDGFMPIGNGVRPATLQ